MASAFSDGLMAGFSVMETIRDRREARANEARRITLAEAAEARAAQAFDMTVEDRARGLAREDQLRRAATARARVLSDPDNVDEADLLMLEQAGDAETLGRLEEYRGQSGFVTKSLSDLAERFAAAESHGYPVTQSPGSAARPDKFSQQEIEFLSPTADSELLPDQTREPKYVPLEDIAPFLAPNDPYLKRSGRTRGLDLSTPEARAAAAASPRRSGARVPIDPNLPTPAEIDALPIAEQEAARARLKEALGGRVQWQADRRSDVTQGGTKRNITLNDQYQGMLDSRQDSELRQLATTQPTAWIERYRADRMTLDENTRALVDRRAVEISAQSLANLRQQVANVPIVNGTVDFASPEGQNLKRGIEHNIAVLSQAEAGFSVARIADIRNGFMPVGNRELAGRVTDAWQAQPPPAKPATAHEERMLTTQLNRIDAQSDNGGSARRISSSQIDTLGKAVARGWISYADAESILLTGRLPQAARALIERDPKNDLYTPDGRLISRGYDAGAEREAREKMTDDQLKFVQAQAELLWPGDEDWQKNLRGRRTQQALVWMSQNRESIMRDRGFDPMAATPAQTATMLNVFAAEDATDNLWSSSLGGARAWLYGTFQEQAPTGSDESIQMTRDWLGADWGVYTLGGVKFNAPLAQQRLLESSNPRDRAAVIAAKGDPYALMEYMRQAYPEAFPGGAPQE